MAGWNVGIYASLSKYGEFNLKELDANGVYKWVADWDVGQAPGIADVWQYNCSVGLGKYTLKLDKDVDITGKLIQSVKAPAQLETDPNGQYPVKAGAFVDFDYSTTSIVGGKMLISSPDGINKIPKLGPDGSFIFNQKDGDRMWVFIKDKISTGQSLNWNNIQNKPTIPSVEGLAKESELADYVKKSEVPKLPDLNGYALKSELPSLKGYAKLTDIPSVVGLVKEAELNDYVKKSDIPKIPDLSGYATVASLIDYAKKTDLPDFSQFVKKSEIPKLPDTSNFATKDVVQQVQTTADSASNKAEQAQSTADANKKDLDNIKANNQVSQVTSGDFNNLTENKTYEISSNSGYTHAPVSGKKGILVVHAGQQCLVQVFYAVDDFVYRRIRYANQWHDWKWNNDWN